MQTTDVLLGSVAQLWRPLNCGTLKIGGWVWLKGRSDTDTDDTMRARQRKATRVLKKGKHAREADTCPTVTSAEYGPSQAGRGRTRRV